MCVLKIFFIWAEEKKNFEALPFTCERNNHTMKVRELINQPPLLLQKHFNYFKHEIIDIFFISNLFLEIITRFFLQNWLRTLKLKIKFQI
jgi:hypothetical protein